MPRRWRRVVIQDIGKFSQVTIQTMTGPDDFRRADLDPVKRVIRLNKAGSEKSDPLEFTYSRSEPDGLTLEGLRKDLNAKDTKIRAQLRRFDESKFLLLNRGFHWINESPFNR